MSEEEQFPDFLFEDPVDHGIPGEAYQLASWVPDDLRAWADKKGGRIPIYERLILRRIGTDERMKDVWDWLKGNIPLTRKKYLAGHSGLSVYIAIQEAAVMPGKPGNYSQKEREKYFLAVRKHASALIELLSNTRYAAAEHYSSELHEDDLDLPLRHHATNWGDDEQGHLFGVWIDDDGVYSLPWDYPECYLSSQLNTLISWTLEEDGFSRDFRKSSKPIGQRRNKNTPVIYFNCTMWEKFEIGGLHLPYAHLAKIANVVFQRDADNELDEETVRKQVTRYRERHNVSIKPVPYEDIGF